MSPCLVRKVLSFSWLIVVFKHVCSKPSFINKCIFASGALEALSLLLTLSLNIKFSCLVSRDLFFHFLTVFLKHVFTQSRFPHKSFFASGTLKVFGLCLALSLNVQVVPMPGLRFEALVAILAGVFFEAEVNIVHVVPEGGLLPELFSALDTELFLGLSFPRVLRLVIVVIRLMPVEPGLVRKVFGAEATDKVSDPLVVEGYVVGQLGLEEEGLGALVACKVPCLLVDALEVDVEARHVGENLVTLGTDKTLGPVDLHTVNLHLVAVELTQVMVGGGAHLTLK